MTEQPENAMIRELSDDELRIVAGAKPMESEAARYTTGATTEMNIFGLTFVINWNTGCWAAWRYGANKPGTMAMGCGSK